MIQQGIENKYYPLFNGLSADYMLVWGKYFKEIFLEKDAREPENIFILGFPTNKIFLQKKFYKPYILCYLAQDYERYDKDLLNIKIENARRISKICKELGIKFLYRPHPWENRNNMENILSNIEFTKIKEKLWETLDRADIFVSFSSTALIEASMGNKISLQTMNYPVKSDNFEELGACDKTFKTLEELEKYLKDLAKSDLDKFEKKFSNNYIETRNNPGKRFLEIIKEIEKQKND
jgi:hypothetical protein